MAENNVPIPQDDLEIIYFLRYNFQKMNLKYADPSFLGNFTK